MGRDKNYLKFSFLCCYFLFNVSCRNTMEADVLNALKSQAAYLSGVREHPLIVVNVPNGELKASWKRQPLDLCLKYLVNSLRWVFFFWKFYCLLWLTFEFRFEYLHKFGSCVALYAFITIGVNFLCISLLLTILTSVFFFLLFSFHRMASITTISKETVNNGLNVVIDTQMCSWRCARNAIQYVSDSLNCNTIRLYAVRPEVFWDKQRVENCTKAQKYLDVSRLSGICGWEFRVRLKCIKLTNHAHFNLGDSRYEISTTEVLQSWRIARRAWRIVGIQPRAMAEKSNCKRDIHQVVSGRRLNWNL